MSSTTVSDGYSENDDIYASADLAASLPKNNFPVSVVLPVMSLTQFATSCYSMATHARILQPFVRRGWMMKFIN